MPSSPKTINDILIKNVPLEVRRYIFRLQADMKSQRGRAQYSQSAVILQIIKNQMISEENSKNKKQ